MDARNIWEVKTIELGDFLDVKNEKERREKTAKCLGWTTGFKDNRRSLLVKEKENSWGHFVFKRLGRSKVEMYVS